MYIILPVPSCPLSIVWCLQCLYSAVDPTGKSRKDLTSVNRLFYHTNSEK